MMKHQFTPSATQDFHYWEKHDPKKIERIKKLIMDIKQNHPIGIGKPEPLKYKRAGLWSRRIDHEHRLVYSVENNMLTIYACRYHYK